MRAINYNGVLVIILLAPWSLAFQIPLALVNIRTNSCPKTYALFARGLQPKQPTLTSPPSTDETTILLLEEKKRAIIDAVSGTNNGITATESQMKRIDSYARALELLNPTPNPAQSESVEGTWRVRYSTAPPPSNGQLGPLRGSAIQSLDLTSGIYANELLVGSDEANPWLSAVLLADWEDRGDGLNWKVNFRTITLTLFGRFDLLKMDFGDGTSRIWTTSFIDKDMRIVRAGRTKSEAKKKGTSADPKDYFLFVMTREPVARKILGDIIVEPKIGLLDVLMDPARFMDDDD